MTKTQTKKPRSERLEFKFFGVPEIRVSTRALRFRSRKTLALLAYLILEPGFHARDKLAALLWSESDQAAGRASLRTALAQINSELGGLISNRDAVAWTADHLELDVHRLERVFRAIGNPSSPELETQLETALALYRGDLLEGFDLSDANDFDDWLITSAKSCAVGWTTFSSDCASFKPKLVGSVARSRRHKAGAS